MQDQKKREYQDIISAWAVKEHGACEVALSAPDLSIVWGSDDRYWKKVEETDPNNGKKLEAAELFQVCWLQIDGKHKSKDLKLGKYEVYFIVKLKDHLNMDPVNLKLTRPDGKPQVHREQLKNKQRNKWIELKVGEFSINQIWDRNVKFSINGSDGYTWKTGLTVIGAFIVPVRS